MAKNLIPEVLKMLGVERGEAFKLRAQDCEVYEDDLFAFNYYDRLIKIPPSGNAEYVDEKMCKILNGYYEIVKLPWEPRDGETVFYPNTTNKLIGQSYWAGDTWDLALKALGMVYQTRKEAEEHFAEDYEKLTGKKINEMA